MEVYELKYWDGNRWRIAEWPGADNIAAAQAFADAHPGATVYATRRKREVVIRDVSVRMPRIVEPGDPDC